MEDLQYKLCKPFVAFFVPLLALFLFSNEPLSFPEGSSVSALFEVGMVSSHNLWTLIGPCSM